MPNSQLIDTLIQNKNTLISSGVTTAATAISFLDQIGDTARSISAILACIVGALTSTKLIKEIFFKKKG